MQFAKGVTSGYVPLGGIGVSDTIREAMNNVPPERRWMHAYTYSGHPTCCAVALRNIQIIEDEGLVERVAQAGQRLLEKLRPLAALDGVGDVRGLGLLAAVEVVADKATKQLHPPDAQVSQRLYEALLERGLYTRVLADTICLAPPFVTSDEQIERVVEAIADAIPSVLSR
jgi:adenosylmethionine-8-amino-7-oxononanoate aminotransferase